MLLATRNFYSFKDDRNRDYLKKLAGDRSKAKLAAAYIKVWKKMQIGYVYAVFCNDHVKFGHTTMIEDRMTNLRCGAPHPIEFIGAVIGSRHLESAIHAYCKESKTRGEWFESSQRVRLVARLIHDEKLDDLLAHLAEAGLAP